MVKIPKWAEHRPTFQKLSWDQYRRYTPPESHGVYAFVGPAGSGKTLLAVHLALQYVRGNAMKRMGICVCGKPECEGKWKAYSNLEGTWKRKKGGNGWAEPLDIAGQLLERDSDMSHSIILLDESYLYTDARRSMRTANLDMGYFVSQRRKMAGSVVKMYQTMQSFDMVDRRVRDQVSRVYNCWTPDSGRNVHAFIHLLALPYLPPYARNPRPKRMKWMTEHSKQYYDTHELVEADEMQARGTEPIVMVNRGEEGVFRVTLTEAIEAVFLEILREDNPEWLFPTQIVEGVQKNFQMRISDRQARAWLDDRGFIRTLNEDSELIYRIMVNQDSEAGVL